ncbi:peptidase, M23 family [Bordetella bronchiseptica 00-P-2730]|nr:peptidase, M23 family [Bordetella bronchiseptica 00-P-2730]
MGRRAWAQLSGGVKPVGYASRAACAAQHRAISWYPWASRPARRPSPTLFCCLFQCPESRVPASHPSPRRPEGGCGARCARCWRRWPWRCWPRADRPRAAAAAPSTACKAATRCTASRASMARASATWCAGTSWPTPTASRRGSCCASSRRARAAAPARRRARPASGKSAGGAPAKPAAPIRGITLIWPADGKVTRQFNGSSVLGITIANSAGTSVVAAAGGTVAYASNGLRGYGNLVIVRHDGSFLTIYAHNRKLLVKQGQRVSQGQRIAEMGDTDSSQVNLYFELRRDGKAVNPAGALPRR